MNKVILNREFRSCNFMLAMIGLGLGLIHAINRSGVSLVNPTYVIIGTYLMSPILGYVLGKSIGILVDWLFSRMRIQTDECSRPEHKDKGTGM